MIQNEFPNEFPNAHAGDYVYFVADLAEPERYEGGTVIQIGCRYAYVKVGLPGVYEIAPLRKVACDHITSVLGR